MYQNILNTGMISERDRKENFHLVYWRITYDTVRKLYYFMYYFIHHRKAAAYNNLYTFNGGIVCRTTKKLSLYIRVAGLPER